MLVQAEPADGAKIGKWSASGQVEGDGTIEFTSAPPGEYRVTSEPNPGSANKAYAPERVIQLDPGATVAVTVAFF